MKVSILGVVHNLLTYLLDQELLLFADILPKTSDSWQSESSRYWSTRQARARL
jgi:hypothetical protein